MSTANGAGAMALLGKALLQLVQLGPLGKTLVAGSKIPPALEKERDPVEIFPEEPRGP